MAPNASPSSAANPISVLFVCLGNIYSRTMDTLSKHGINDYSHRARKISESDFDTFDYIFAMDRSNLRDLQRMQQRAHTRRGTETKAQVMLYGAFGGKNGAEVVGDPYYGGDDGFEEVYEQVCRFGRAFLSEVVGEVEAR
ncbi:hypothetical protein DV737_g766, partial [Chaetothyriales sp. CBS 132003]